MTQAATAERAQHLADEAWLAAHFRENYALLLSIGRVFVGSAPEQMDGIDDAIQDVFAALWRKRAQLRSHPNVDAWLVEALRRQLRGRLSRAARRAKRAQMDSLDAMEGAADRMAQTAYPDPAEALAGREHYNMLVTLLGQETADIFYAYCVKGVPAKALAQTHQCSEACIWTRVSRAKKRVLSRADLFFALAVAILLCR